MSSASSEKRVTSEYDDDAFRPTKRVRQWTQSDRAKHRVVERERREAFNEQLMELASLLPSLDTCKHNQLGKRVIVSESIRRHRDQEAATAAANEKAIILSLERNALLEEVNQWRAINGIEPVRLGTLTGRTLMNLETNGEGSHISDDFRTRTTGMPTTTPHTSSGQFSNPAYRPVGTAQAKSWTGQAPNSSPPVWGDDWSDIPEPGQLANYGIDEGINDTMSEHLAAMNYSAGCGHGHWGL